MAGFTRLLLDHIKARPVDDPIWAWNDKLSGRGLAHLAGVPVPGLIQVGELSQLKPPDQPVAVKPNQGCAGRGVWLLRPSGAGYRQIGDDTAPKTTWRQVVDGCRRAERKPHPNLHEKTRGPWLVEAAVHGHRRPDDWKAWVVGGEVACWQQIRRAPDGGKLARGWTPDFTPADLWTKPAGILDGTLPEPAHPGRLAAAARAVAALLPAGAPAVRVDFYDQGGHVWFGEITPNPADGRNIWSPEWDRRLGDLWPS